MTAARTSFDIHHEQAERALQVMRVQQRRLRWQRRLGWGLFAALIAIPLYSVIPPPYGPGQPGVVFVVAAILFAVLILGGERRSPWLATGSTGRRTIRALAPAVVVHAGAEEVAVEIATPSPARSALSTAQGSTSDSAGAGAGAARQSTLGLVAAAGAVCAAGRCPGVGRRGS